MMLHTKYKGSRPCSFRQDFFIFSLYVHAKHVTPGHGHFRSEGHHLNKIVRGLLGDTTF